MSLSFQKNEIITIISSASSGILVYLLLGYLLVSQRMTIPISIIMAILIFGLTRYYSTPGDDSSAYSRISSSENVEALGDNDIKYPAFILFVGLYITLLVISTLTSKPNLQIFVNWSEIEPINIIQLGTAILLSFFLPGYAVTHIIIRKYRINPMLKILLAYLFSILITGGIGYLLNLILDIPASDSKNFASSTYLVILVIFVISYYINGVALKNRRQNSYHLSDHFSSYFDSSLLTFLKRNGSELLVLGSIFMLLILSTYYLFGGITVGDQWFQQGRALLFMTGSIKEAALANTDILYPPFQSAVLATLTTLSGLPLINNYSSIAFLNIIFIFAFYYFTSKWLPINMQRARILASTFIAIGSGFGWIYLLGLTVTTNPVVSQNSVLNTITSTEPFDVFQPTNFLFASHPDFSTGLIYIVLPAGFVLLGLLRDNFNKFTLLGIVTSISVLGILSHDEFYLFIIVGSILPLPFKIKHANYIYLAFLLSLSIVYLIDIINPEKYYTSTYVLELPLLVINLLFTGIMYALYFTQKNLGKGLSRRIIPKEYRSRSSNYMSRHNPRLYFLIGVFIVSMVGYVYVLSFIVLGHLSTNDIIHQTSGYGTPYNIPWYLYSMKFGITGLLGLVSILSYVFKKFEREVFVFGIIIVISLLAGPYYDEHRLSKYIMIGLAGFAAIFVYKILNYLKDNDKRVLSRLLIGIIITTASISSILYIGFNSLILQTQDFVHTLSRRNFPSESEMSLFQSLYNKNDVESKRYNIVSFPNEYNDLEKGLMTKLQAFSGLPTNIIYQNQLTLNVSSLDAFYNLLDGSGTRYIIIPRSSIDNTHGTTEPVQFAISHFQHTYEDGKYIVLEVPELKPPSSFSETDTALVYKDNRDNKTTLSTIADSKLLQYNNSTFNFGGETNYVIVQNGNKSERAILSAYDSNEGLTLWSRELDKSAINVVEVGFRILKENSEKNSHVGLKWKESDNEYYLSLSKNGLELTKKIGNSKLYDKLLYNNLEIEKKNYVDYSLRLENTQNSTNIIFNSNLKIQVPRTDPINNSDGISKVGITMSDSIVEFGPIKTGKISTQKIGGDGTKYNDYYYPLSILALSKSKYDIFMDNDLSAFSKKTIVLATDPLELDDKTINRYLEYLKKGGTILVMNSHDFKGKFGQFFSIKSKPNDMATFTNIVGKNNEKVSVSGSTKRVLLYDSPDVETITTYRDKENRMIAPLAIEKRFTNGGKILLFNNEAYFNALSKSPHQYFLSLSNITRLLGLEGEKAKTSETISAQANRFVGDLNLSGNITINSSSIIFDDRTGTIVNNPNDIYSDNILISNKRNDLNGVLNNATIKDLRLVGQYDVIIKSNGTLAVPNSGSQHEYFKILVPARFNMTVNLLPSRLGYAELDIVNGSSSSTIKVNSGSKISFYNVSIDRSSKPIEIVLKSPEVKVDGHIGFKESNFDPYFTDNYIPLDYEGGLKTKLAFVDDYKESNINQTTIKYITYIQSISTEGGMDQTGITLNLPGDISPYAKSHGILIPLRESLFSVSNIILLLSISIVTIWGSWMIWPKIKPT